MTAAVYVAVALAVVVGAYFVTVGIAGLTGRLPFRGRFGVRTPDTLANPDVFAAANRVAGPAVTGGGAICLVGGVSGLVAGGWLGLGAVVVALVAGVVVIGMGASYGAQAAATLMVPAPSACTSAAAPPAEPAHSEGESCETAAAGGCGSCVLQGSCERPGATSA